MDLHEILDPRGAATSPAAGARAPRLTTLTGARLALIDNGKPNANLLLAALVSELAAHDIGTVQMYTKPHIGIPIDQTTLETIQQTADFAVAALGDCGSCSAGTTSDALLLERNGVPAVPICTTPFRVTAASMARKQGLHDFNVLLPPHPVASLTADEVAECAARLADDLVRILTGQAR